MLADEIQRRLSALKQAATDFTQAVMVLDNKFDGKETELKALELRIDRIKEESNAVQKKANDVLQQASEEAARERNEAKKLLEEAKVAKIQAKEDQDRAQRMTAESQAMMKHAIDRQKEADLQYRILEEKKNRILEAAR